MLKRLAALALLALALAGHALPQRSLVAGPALPGPRASLPPIAGGWAGLPDTDPSSGRFLSVSGNANYTLPAAGNGGVRNVIRLSFEATQDRVEIAAFDPGTEGLWDQRVDGTFVLQQPDTLFQIFADPDGTVGQDLAGLGGTTTATPITVVRALDASLLGKDGQWCPLYSAAIDDPLHASAYNDVDGRFHFVIITQLAAAPGSNLSGYEANGYKLAFNGTYVVPAGAIVGVTCGVIDGLEILGPGNTGILVSNDPFPDILPLGQGDGITNSYDGTLELPFEGASFCDDLQIQEADSDWNRALAPGETIDTNPTGVPPDSGIPYANPQPPLGVRDASAFAITGSMAIVSPTGATTVRAVPALGYQVLRPDGVTQATDADSTARDSAGALVPWGKASITNQFMPGWNLPTPDPFAYITIPGAALEQFPGLWKLRAVGLDARNAIFFRWNQDFGTTERRIPVTVTAFCDSDRDGTQDTGEEALAGVEVTLSLGTTGISRTGLTDAQGKVTFRVTHGTWQLTVGGTAAQTVLVPLPKDVVVTGCEKSLRVPLPFDCTGAIRGTVYLNQVDCDLDYDAGRDLPLAGVTVGLWRASASADSDPVLTTVTDVNGNYEFSGIEPGAWAVRVVRGQALLAGLDPTMPLERSVQVKRGEGINDQDFGYCVIESRIVGRVFRERGAAGCDGLWQADDAPIAGVAVLLEPIDPLGAPRQATTDAQGQYAFPGLQPGAYRVSVAGSQPQLAVLAPGAALSTQVTLQGGDEERADFPFCPARLCGTVYLNAPGGDCDADYDAGVDQPLAGVSVKLWSLFAPPPADALATAVTGLDGGYCLGDLDAGLYLVQVGNNQPALAQLVATRPVQRSPLVLAGSTVTGQDFGYCALGALTGRVFRDSGEKGCDGIWQADDTPVAGVAVVLAGLSPVRPAVQVLTGADGRYAFSGIEPGTYSVSVAGNQPQLVGVAPGAPTSVPLSFAGGDQRQQDFPFCPARLCGTVYRNSVTGGCDGDYDLGIDTPLAGVVVKLWTVSALPPAAPALVATTGLDGRYCFRNLDAGVYLVQVGAGQAQLVGLVATQPVQRAPFVAAGTVLEGQDFGYCAERSSLAGRVFRDSGARDCDGIYQADDTPIPGVTVVLEGLLPVRPPVVTVTDVLGRYAFTGLEAGTYVVRVDGGQPQLLGLAPGGALAVEASFLGGEAKEQDFPFCPAKVCGTVYFNDRTNGCDGDYDLGIDTPLPGVAVNLWLATSPTTDPALATTLTGLDGGYCFRGLPAGAYRLQVAGGQPQLVGLRPEGAATRLPVVVAGQSLLGQDFGYCTVLKAALAGRVFADSGSKDCDGIYQADDTPIPGVTVALVGVSPVRPPVVTVTGLDGTYAFTGLEPGAYAVSVDGSQPQLALLAPGGALSVPVTLLEGEGASKDFPFCPAKVCGTVYFNDRTNGCDGDYDLGIDTPLPGVAVNLWLATSPTTDPALATTLTGLDGGYCFRGLPAGAYRLQVAGGQPQLVGLRPEGAATRLPVVVAGQSLLGQDFGYCTALKAALAGRVFRESGEQGCDGIFQPDDAPIAGVRVVLAGTSPVRLPVEQQTAADGTYAFTGLEPGAYTVSVDGSQPLLVVLAPGGALSVPVTLLEGEVRTQDFPFCGGSICGRVYENDLGNGCDGDYDLGDMPLAGVTVGLWFANEGPPAAPRFTAVTGADGRYCFRDLEARGWRVQVLPGQAGLAGLQATLPVVRTPVVLPGGTVEGQDFGYCPLLGRIYGVAYLNPPCTNDTTLDAGDTRLANVRVMLALIDGDAVTPFELLTGPDGSYDFTGLRAGTYQVRVEGSDPVLVNLWAATPTVVGPFALAAGGEQRVDFGFSQQRAGGIVYRDGACPADGSYGPGDVPLAGVVVEALQLDGAGQGTVREAVTGLDGRFLLSRLPVGRYELGIPAGQAVLGGLLPVAGTVRTIQVGPGGCVTDVDFGWKAPPADVLARVFAEPAGFADGSYDAGRDAWLPGITVTLGGTEVVTDADGFARFPAVAAGSVTVSVNAWQPALARYTPSTPTSVVLAVDGCVEREARFGFSRVCDTTCCEGDLREVVVGTSFWVGSNVKLYDIVARLEVQRGSTYVEVDSASRAWRDSFGAPLAGANDVLEVLDVQVRDGVACVVVRLRATGALFPGGVFGSDRYKLRVSLNGESHYGCGVLRCESFRPGMYFSLPDDGSGIPACNSGWTWDGTCSWDMPWLSSRDKECPRYIVLDTSSQAEWECQNLAIAPLTASR